MDRNGRRRTKKNGRLGPEAVRTAVAVVGVCLALASNGVGASAAAAEAVAQIPLRTLALAQSSIDSLPPAQRQKLHARTRVLDKRGGPPLDATIAFAGRTIDVPIDADGVMTLPTDPQILAANPVVRFNRPKGSLGLEVGVSIVPPDAPDAPVGYYRDAAEAAQAALAVGAKKQAKFLSVFFMPKVRAIGFSFAECCGRVEITGSDRRFEQTGEGRVEAPLDAFYDARARTVRVTGKASAIIPILE